MWGAAHDPGFHATPWGDVHTPLAGLELISLYFLRLQLYLFEAPIPALVPAAVALLLAPRLSGFDRYLLTASALLVGLYWTYWHDGFFLGPRFMYPLAPALILWTARAWPMVRDRLSGAAVARRAVGFALVTSLPLAMVNVTLIRGQQYRNGLQTMRFDADKAARQQGITGALILVRESWGAEIMARLWTAGIGRGDSEQLYRRVDTCLLDLALLEVEAEDLHGADAMVRLTPLLRDTARVVPSGLSPDETQMALDGTVYPARCVERIRDDWQGFTLFTPTLLAGQDGNIFVRDLRERNHLLKGLGEGRPVYRLQPDGPQEGLPPRFVKLGDGLEDSQ
jgi:hypothetical protein